jgi:PhnB protein
MATQPIPDGFHTVTPFLNIKGARAFIAFLEDAFDARALYCMDAPDGSVRHAQVRIGDSMVMVSESCEQWPATPGALYLYVPDVDAVYAKAVRAGATSIMAPADQFYGDRNAGVRDPYGNVWWIGTHIEDVAPDELERRGKAAFGQHG